MSSKKRPAAVRPHLFERLHPDGKRLVRGWFRRAQESYAADSSPFEAFIFIWIAFNGWAACVTQQERDADMVEAVAFDPDLCRCFSSLMAGDPSFEKQVRDFASFWPIFKASEIRQQSLMFAGEAPRPMVIAHYLAARCRTFQPRCMLSHARNPPLDWPHTLKAIYRVRNNLFHGEKARHSEMDIAIVDAAYQVLMTFIDHSSIFFDSAAGLAIEPKVAP